MELADRRFPFSLTRLIAEAKRRARQRRFLLSALAVTVVTTAVVSVVYAESSNGGLALSGTVSGPILEGSGVICAGSSGVWFSSPPVIGGPSDPSQCGGDIQLEGFNTSRLSAVPGGHGVTAGRAFVKGVDSNGVLHVSGQGRPLRGQMTGTVDRGTALADLPCRQPAGGWPRGWVPRSVWARIYAKLQQRDVTAWSYFRFIRHSTFVVAASSTNPAATRRALEPLLRKRVCVFRSRYSKSVVARWRNRLEADMRGLSIYTAGGPALLSPSGQPVLEARTLLVTPALRAWLRKTPPGLIRVIADLRQVGRHSG